MAHRHDHTTLLDLSCITTTTTCTTPSGGRPFDKLLTFSSHRGLRSRNEAVDSAIVRPREAPRDSLFAASLFCSLPSFLCLYTERLGRGR